MFRSLISARTVIAVVLLSITAVSCGKRSVRARTPVAPARIGNQETGLASWYGVPYHGRPTASGEIYDMQQLTAAHRDLPFETWVEVTNLENGKRVDVRINDRGPFVRGRIIDLSQAAARDIEMLGPGTVKVRLKVIPVPVQSAKQPTRSPQPLKRQSAPEAEPASSQTLATNEAITTESKPSETRTDQLVSQSLPNVAAKPAPLLPARTSPSLPLFAVQAGAFADRDRAESLRNTMAESFLEARVVSNGKNPPLWRVLVGREMTSDQASQLAIRVRREVGESRVVPEPSPEADPAPAQIPTRATPQ